MLNKTNEESGERSTILFVDDEPLSLKYFKASVGPYANVLTADSPAAARKILEREGDAISVVVSDERMPQESGAHFLSDVRKSKPSAVLVLTSAYADFQSLQDAVNGAGIYRFVPKPWNLDELCAAMQEALTVERAARAAAPANTPVLSIAEDASLELLVVLARELATSFDGAQKSALEIAALTRAKPAALMPDHGASATRAWAAQLCAGQIARAAAGLESEVRYCRSLTQSLAGLAAQLADATGATASMAETAAMALEQIAHRQSGRRRVTLDARQDFRYALPQQIMSFVLVNLLSDAVHQDQGAGLACVTMDLIPGNGFNEVRITSQAPAEDGGPKTRPHDPGERVNRSALWAFGGELLFSSDRVTGSKVTSVRLPALSAATGTLPPP